MIHEQHSNEQIVAELIWNMRIIKEIIGVTPTLFRPPFSDIDPRVRAIAKALGLQVIIWYVAKLASTYSVSRVRLGIATLKIGNIRP